MSHQALARRYRPRGFAEVTAQGHVSDTLRRAVASDRVGHAYLFCGPRGVGKTTLARVLAMALNCQSRTPEGEPCGACESCQRTWSGQTALDVVEIDAASNRGVDDARDLRERAMYAPSEAGRYKIYIVDEAHMLTREAWNALLKILEEPPPRVIFIFATTEPQKIQQSAAPILSRCQRFDFRRIGVQDISGRLAEVLGREGISAPEDALRMVARRAEGGMRDALSLMDQVLALTGGEITPDSVRRVLGLVEDERYLEVMGILAERRHADVFTFLEALLDEGYDLAEFYYGWVESLRTLLRVRLGEVPPEVREDLVEPLRALAAGFEPADLVRMLSLSSELESTGSLRRSGNPRLLLEMLFLRLSYLDRTVDLERLIRGLGGAPTEGPGHPPTASRPPQAAPPSRGAPAAGAPGERRAAPSPGPAVADASTPASGPAPRTSSPASEGGSRDLAAVWPEVLDGAHGRLPPGLGLLLRAGSVRETAPGRLYLTVPPGPAAERLVDPSTRGALVDALSAGLGRRIELDSEEGAADGNASPPPRVSAETVREGRLKGLLDLEPLLGQAVEELDLELLE